DDILHSKSFDAISLTTAELEKTGLKAQVHPREINFFYIKEKLRERIVQDQAEFLVLNTDIRFSKAALEAEIRNFPERFSPNVVMRPLFQELILPNLAYVGGGAEIIYWLQLKRNFDQFGISFPILILRNSALLSDPETSRRLHRLGLDYQSLFMDPEQLKKQWVLAHTQHELHLK